MGRRDFKFKNRDNEQMSKAISDDNFWTNYEMTAEEYQMRVAISPHHTNPRSSTLDFWRKTTDIERYRVIQAQKKKQINIPTSSNMNKQEHLIIAHRLAEMEKRRIGTRFLDHEVSDADRQKPLAVVIQEK